MPITKKFATLATLPRELRQNILAIAFKDAASKDIKINQNLRKLTWDMKEEAHELVEMVHHSRYINEEPLFYQSHVPAIYNLAYTLSLALPALEEDIKVMLKKCLDGFDEENNEVYQKDNLLKAVSRNKSTIPNYLPFPRPAQHSWFATAEQLKRARLGWNGF